MDRNNLFVDQINFTRCLGIERFDHSRLLIYLLLAFLNFMQQKNLVELRRFGVEARQLLALFYKHNVRTVKRVFVIAKVGSL